MAPRPAQLLLAALVAALLAPGCLAAQARSGATLSSNPVRKVVSMLQAMERKVREQGEKEQELFDKFMCYCKTGVGSLEKSIADAETKIPALKADIESSSEQVEESKETLKQEQAERESTQQAVDEASALREKEAAAYASEKDEYTANIAAITKAVDAIEKGVAGSLLQTELVATLRGAIAKQRELLEEDREEVLAFLSGGQVQGASYAPASGQIVGILKQMGDTMEKNLADATEQEKEAIKTYESLMVAKKRELEALTSSIESKTKKIGELNVAVVEMKADLADTADSLTEDQAFAKELEKGCSTKSAEWAERQKTRSEELLAISDTIKTLNDDDALELFKKTLPAPGASLVQVGVTSASQRARAVALVQQAQAKSGADHARLGFLVLALRGQKVGFERVIKMIDEMVTLLKKEQTDDAQKKEYCGAQFDSTDDKKKSLTREVSDLATAIASAEESISAAAEDISALEAGIAALDKSVAEATALRKGEHEEYKALMAADGAAKELLLFAKNRLNQFYNPKLYNPPAKVELSAQGAIERDMTSAAALVQLSEHSHRTVAAAPPPETWSAYAKKTEESGGVIAMLDLLVKDLDREMTEAETEEKDSQADYDTTIADAKDKRMTDSKALTSKAAAKADLESDLQAAKDDKASTAKELMVTDKYLSQLHAECDWLIQYYDAREQARSGEIDALGKAKAVLSGADYSLL